MTIDFTEKELAFLGQILNVAKIEVRFVDLENLSQMEVSIINKINQAIESKAKAGEK